jgi:glutamate synthase domain-containing protein 1
MGLSLADNPQPAAEVVDTAMPPYSRSAVRAHSELDPPTLGEDTLNAYGSRCEGPLSDRFRPKE